jgi:hypothetical protein
MGIGSIFGVVAGILKKVWDVGKILLPIVEAFRAASPEVDQVLDKVDSIIDEGGEVADDFFDRNLPTFLGMQEFYRDMQVAGATGEAFIAAALQASQVDTPDEITPEEVQMLSAKLWAHKSAIEGFFSRQDELAEGLKAMK